MGMSSYFGQSPCRISNCASTPDDASRDEPLLRWLRRTIPRSFIQKDSRQPWYCQGAQPNHRHTLFCKIPLRFTRITLCSPHEGHVFFGTATSRLSHPQVLFNAFANSIQRLVWQTVTIIADLL
jgi:hypothetical protein